MDPYGQPYHMQGGGSMPPPPPFQNFYPPGPPLPPPLPYQNLGPAPSGSPQTLSSGLGGYPPPAAPPQVTGFGPPAAFDPLSSSSSSSPSSYSYGISPTSTYPPPVYGTSSAPASTFAQAPLHAPASQPVYALGGSTPASSYYGMQQSGPGGGIGGGGGTYYAPHAGSVMTPQQLDAYTKAFQVYDRDKDGYISMEELGTALRALGHPCSIPELKDLIRSADRDGDMRIDMQEFAALMATRVAQDEANLLRTFRAFDKDKNGRISKAELQQAMSQLGQQLSSQQIKKMMEIADADGDGELNYNEFARMLSMQQ